MNYSYYTEYRVKVGKGKMTIRFMGNQLEKLFKFYNIPYEIIGKQDFMKKENKDE